MVMSFDSDPVEQTAFGLSDAWMHRIRAAIEGRFEIVRPLGRGGMAVVFLAQDIALGRRVALKVAIAGPDGDLDRIRREAKLAASLEHPNIVSVHAVGDGDGLAYFAMQYVRGRTLEQLLAEEDRMAPERALAILADVADALAYAHRRGVIHRDIKPANVMIGEEGRTYVADFGIARTLGQPGITTTGVLIGSPSYMAPEQFNGELPTTSIDQYALGCLGYELLTGSVPFAGDDVASVLKGHLLSAIPSVRASCPEVPQFAAHAIERMLSKEASARFPNLESVRDVLRSGGITEASIAVQPVASGWRAILASPAVGARSVLVLGSGLVSVLVLAVGIRSLGTHDEKLSAYPTPGANLAEEMSDEQPALPAAALPPAAPGGPPMSSGKPQGIRPPTGTPPTAQTESLAATDPTSVDTSVVLPAVLSVASRLPAALLYLGTDLRAVLAERNVPATLSLPPGRYQISVRFDACLSWDSVIVLAAGDSLRLTRTPRCSNTSTP